MKSRLYRMLLFAAYQVALFIGIFMLPFALILGRMGVNVPFHRPAQVIKTRMNEAD
jgi:hypothetical protein